jgi:hypothetical protein
VGAVVAVDRTSHTVTIPQPSPDARKSAVKIEEHAVVDFGRLLLFLRSRGHGIDSIALYAKLSRTAVRNYLEGTTPLHPHGERLIRFWCEISGNTRDLVPTKSDLPTVSTSRF